MRSLLPFLAVCSSTVAYTCLGSPKTVSLQWSFGWKWISPDGFGRPVVAVNDQWPPPTIDMCKGDRLVVQVTNNLGNETASIHFHGIYQIGQNQMDGPPASTQCPIPPGSVFTYDFTVEQQVGTYWWHTHVHGQIADGLRGPLIVHDPSPPFNTTGGELIVTVADWYHTQAPYLIEYYQSAENAANGGPEPIPDTGLLNDGQNLPVSVQPGKTYLLRVINPGNFVGSYLKIDGHNLTVVEVDGVYTEPYTVDLLYLTVAQRYAVLLTTHDSSSQNFLIQAALDTSMFDEVPDGYNPNFYGYLVYDSSQPLPPQIPLPQNTEYLDDTQLATSPAYTADQVFVYDHVDVQLVLNLNFSIINNQTRATLNGTTGIPQIVPSLYTALSAGSNAWNPLVYGVNSIPFVIKHNQIVEVIINNFDTGSHPWHLHGATFQVIARNGMGEGYYEGQHLTPSHPNPLRRDTVMINAGGFLALRFKANNPGVHLMHCHIEWHVEAGLTSTFIVAPDIVQRTISIPRDHIDACRRQHIPTVGNAAGNDVNFLDLTGAPTMPDPHPMGALINASLLGPSGKHGEYWPSSRKHWAPWIPRRRLVARRVFECNFPRGCGWGCC
ncbi:multicopper oxidase [Xylaria longipes]|nr:multicopper oxidase [Xylaria longipes]